MKILLLYPRMSFRKLPTPSWVPLGLPFIASRLRQEGHVVSLFDRFSSQARLGIQRSKIDQAMLEGIRRFQPDLIGLNTVSPQIHDTVHCVDLIRKTYSGMMVAGGHHATALPEITLLKIPGLDGTVEAEGEITLTKLAKGEDPATIPGLWWRKRGGAIVHTPPQTIQNLDDLPFPALDLLDMAFYTRPGRHAIRGHYLSSVSILTSRGCSRRCDFCSESLTYGRGVRFHHPDYVLEWIQHLLKNDPVEGIYFHDNDFLIDEPRARGICERLLSHGLEKKIKWSIQTRVDRVHTDILRLLKRAGCISIEFGVESALQSQLDSVHKGTTVDLNERAIALCRKEGFSVHVYMITGFEGEKVPDLDQNLRWVKRMKPNTFYWFPLEIYPGTALYREKGNRFFEENEWSEEKVSNYFKGDGLSAVSHQERDQWVKRKFLPYHNWRRRLNLLRVNPPLKIISLVLSEAKYFFLNLRQKTPENRS